MDTTIPENLGDLLNEMKKPAIAFSGGTDSSYLLYAVSRCCDDFRTYSVDGPFRSPVERSNAARIADMLGIDVVTIPENPLGSPDIVANGPDRCYLCKRLVFSSIGAFAERDGCTAICDATNASDDPSSRPGMKALSEMGVVSPLREAGLTKADIRALSEKAGLPCWNTPSDSCLATRIATHTPITADLLNRTAETEEALRSIGFSGIRVRYRPDDNAVLEIPPEQMMFATDRKDVIDGILLQRYKAYTIAERKSQ